MNFYRWIADRLPRKLVYFAVIRAWAVATTGEFSNTNALRITVDTTLRRWEGKGRVRKIKAAETTGKEVAI